MLRVIFSISVTVIATIVCATNFVEAQTAAGRAPTVDTSGESYATSFSPLPDGGSITSTAFESGMGGAPVNFYVAEAQAMYGYQQQYQQPGYPQANGYQQQAYNYPQGYQPYQQGFAPQQSYAQYGNVQPFANGQNGIPYQNVPYQAQQPYPANRYAQAPTGFNQPMQYPSQPQQNNQQQTQPNQQQNQTQPANNTTTANTTSASYKQPIQNQSSNFEQVGYRQPTYQPIGRTQPAQWQTPLQNRVAQNTGGPVWRTANYQAPGCCGQQQPSPFTWAPAAKYTPQTQNFTPPAAPQFAPVVGQPPASVAPPSYNPYTAPTPNRTQWKPLIPLRSLPPGIYVAQGIIGQPVAYVDGEPVRNFVRYIFP